MASPSKTTAQQADDDYQASVAASEAAPAPEATARDKASHKAREAELARQKDVADAIAAAGADELPKLGGPLLEPGLGA